MSDEESVEKEEENEAEILLFGVDWCNVEEEEEMVVLRFDSSGGFSEGGVDRADNCVSPDSLMTFDVTVL